MEEIKLEYFLNKEKKYNEEYIAGLTQRDSFLEQKPFTRFFSSKDYKYNNQYDELLNEVEKLLIVLFLGKYSYNFRYGIDHELLYKMQDILDGILKKTPKCEYTTLYRFLRSHDKRDFKIGDIYNPNFSLTTSLEILNEDEDLYIITPLPKEKTKAYQLFEIYNHGEEYQVNFLKGAKFEVVNIEDDNIKRIYLKEIE